MNGILNLLKPAGMTSHQVVSAVRRLYHIKKVGHAGTLDPMAIGVLPVFVGNGTKIIEYMDTDKKSYRCEMTLGFETDTQDIWGTITKKTDYCHFSFDEVSKAAENLTGEIIQQPPIYSALKVNGKRLYEYARSGEPVNAKARNVFIYRLQILRVDQNRVLFDITCSKGTYVRTICVDLGKALGSLGTMSFLIRTTSSIFRLQDAVTFEQLFETEQPEKCLLPIDIPLIDMNYVNLEKTAADRFLNGSQLLMDKNQIAIKKPSVQFNLQEYKDQKRILSRLGANEEFVKVYFDNRLIGIAKHKIIERKLVADKVLK